MLLRTYLQHSFAFLLIYVKLSLFANRVFLQVDACRDRVGLSFRDMFPFLPFRWKLLDRLILFVFTLDVIILKFHGKSFSNLEEVEAD